MRKLSFLLIVCCILTGAAKRQKTTIPTTLKQRQPVETKKTETDTIRYGLGDIKLAGFEKAQSSSSESMFITNGTPYTIKGISFNVEYLDSEGRQLHKSTNTVKCNIPESETRNINWKSWDKQHLWYYCKTSAKTNEYGTPFDIKIHINYIIVPDE